MRKISPYKLVYRRPAFTLTVKSCEIKKTHIKKNCNKNPLVIDRGPHTNNGNTNNVSKICSDICQNRLCYSQLEASSGPRDEAAPTSNQRRLTRSRTSILGEKCGFWTNQFHLSKPLVFYRDRVKGTENNLCKFERNPIIFLDFTYIWS